MLPRFARSVPLMNGKGMADGLSCPCCGCWVSLDGAVHPVMAIMAWCLVYCYTNLGEAGVWVRQF